MVFTDNFYLNMGITVHDQYMFFEYSRNSSFMVDVPNMSSSKEVQQSIFNQVMDSIEMKFEDFEVFSFNETFSDRENFGSSFYMMASVHNAHKNNLLILVPLYLLICIVWFYYYTNRAKFSYFFFKFSKVTSVLYKYLCFKIVASILHLVFYELIYDMEVKKLFNRTTLVIFMILNFVVKLVPYVLFSFFSVGYCIKFFSVRPHKLMFSKAFLASILFAISLFSEFLNELLLILRTDGYISQYLQIFMGLCALFGITLTLYNFKKTYENEPEEEKVKITVLILAFGYLISPFICVPYVGDFLEVLKSYLANEHYYESYKMPDLVELCVIPLLMYVWRDQEETYSKLEVEH